MATQAEKDKLVEVLKFTPRTYKIRLWGYGGEYVMGTVDRKIYDYFRRRRLSVPDYAWDTDYADEQNIPEDMQPFYSGQWYDCDDLGHVYGVDSSAGTLQIDDENGDTVYERRLEDLDGCDVELCYNEEVWIDMAPKGTVVYFGYSSDKGTFFEGEIELTMPFDPEKLSLKISDFDGNDIISGVEYDGVEIDNWGGDTNGKGSDHAFYIAGSNTGSGYESYRDMDSIKYTMTEWFPKKTNPARVGKYEVETKDGYTYQANWNGEFWHNDWSPEEQLKVKQWRGVAYDPDEQFLRDELDQLAVQFEGLAPTAAELDELEQMNCTQCEWTGKFEQTNDWDGQMCCPECGEPVEFSNGGDETELEELKMEFDQLMTEAEENDRFNPWAKSSNEPTEEKTLTHWTVKTQNKKSIEEIEYFTKDGMTIVHRTGWRWGEWTVATNDGNPPEFELGYVPGGDGAKDSIDMNNCYVNNIEEVEMVETSDGCWEDTEWPDDMDEDEQERLQEAIDEEGYYTALEEDGWMHDETEMWIWGPIEISNEAGEVVKVINE